MSKAIILVGGTGCGKTHFAKKLIKPVNKKALFVFDVNGEYEDFYPHEFNPNIDSFLNQIYDIETDKHLAKKCVVLMEDATSFFPTNGKDATLIKMLIAKRHSGNTYIMLFHNLQDVPKYIVRKCTDMVIFKTNDSPKYTKSEFDYLGIYEAWQSVQDLAAKNPFYSSQPPPKGTTPNFKHISLY
jgi:DNA helicase HerA-like ATPase